MIELSMRFAQAKSNSFEATAIIVEYFMKNIEQRLQNLNLTPNDYNNKYHTCLKVILQNIHKYYDYEQFISITFKEMKDIIYLNKEISELNSCNIIEQSNAYIRARILNENFDALHIPIIHRECARLYYVNNVTIEELAIMYKCTKTIIYKRLREVANAIFMTRHDQMDKNQLM